MKTRRGRRSGKKLNKKERQKRREKEARAALFIEETVAAAVEADEAAALEAARDTALAEAAVESVRAAERWRAYGRLEGRPLGVKWVPYGSFLVTCATVDAAQIVAVAQPVDVASSKANGAVDHWIVTGGSKDYDILLEALRRAADEEEARDAERGALQRARQASERAAPAESTRLAYLVDEKTNTSSPTRARTRRTARAPWSASTTKPSLRRT